MNWFYWRISDRTFFLLPAIAVGTEEGGKPFIELAWFNVAIGLGTK